MISDQRKSIYKVTQVRACPAKAYIRWIIHIHNSHVALWPEMMKSESYGKVVLLITEKEFPPSESLSISNSIM
jgi:hypothetical protein